MRQPWAWAIVHGGKDVENRSRNVAGSYRGPVLIHAGQGWSDEGAVDDLVIQAAVDDNPADEWMVRQYGVDPRFEDYHRGAVIGVVDIVHVHEPTRWCSPWGQPTGVHLVLDHARPLTTPIPAKGRLGLWTPDQDLVDAVLERLVEAPA